jgi:hypothetical protein
MARLCPAGSRVATAKCSLDAPSPSRIAAPPPHPFRCRIIRALSRETALCYLAIILFCERGVGCL